MTQITLKAPDIECDGCANSIKRAIGRINGIETVEVDVDAKNVAVKYDERLTDSNKIAEVLDRAGFPVAS